MTIQITPLEAFNDNYIWAIHNDQHCYVVDPGQSHPVNAYLEHKQLTLSGILITHHHHDHVGGLVELQHQHNCPAWGPDDDRIDGDVRRLSEADWVDLDTLNRRLQILFIPGHTLSHIAFYNDDWLFCGDTLFSLGCGRMFEGHPAMFVESLDKIMALPDHLNVYCGHEYTQSNGRFARAVEPDSIALADFCRRVDIIRKNNQPSLPSQLGTEKKINPFLRCHDPIFRQQLESQLNKPINNAVDCFAHLRQWKDEF